MINSHSEIAQTGLYKPAYSTILNNITQTANQSKDLINSSIEDKETSRNEKHSMQNTNNKQIFSMFFSSTSESLDKNKKGLNVIKPSGNKQLDKHIEKSTLKNILQIRLFFFWKEYKNKKKFKSKRKILAAKLTLLSFEDCSGLLKCYNNSVLTNSEICSEKNKIIEPFFKKAFNNSSLITGLSSVKDKLTDNLKADNVCIFKFLEKVKAKTKA